MLLWPTTRPDGTLGQALAATFGATAEVGDFQVGKTHPRNARGRARSFAGCLGRQSFCDVSRTSRSQTGRTGSRPSGSQAQTARQPKQGSLRSSTSTKPSRGSAWLQGAQVRKFFPWPLPLGPGLPPSAPAQPDIFWSWQVKPPRHGARPRDTSFYQRAPCVSLCKKHLGTPVFQGDKDVLIPPDHLQALPPSTVFTCAQVRGLRRHNRLRDTRIHLCRKARWHTDAERLVTTGESVATNGPAEWENGFNPPFSFKTPFCRCTCTLYLEPPSSTD